MQCWTSSNSPRRSCSPRTYAWPVCAPSAICCPPPSHVWCSPNPRARASRAFCRAPTGWMKRTKSCSRPSRRFWQARNRWPPRHPPRSRKLAGLAAESAHCARAFVNRMWRRVLRHRHFEGARRSRLAGRMARPSRIARLAGRRVHASGIDPGPTLGTCGTSSAPSSSATPIGRRPSRARRSTSAIPTTACWRARTAIAWMPKWCTISRCRSPACWSSGSAAPACGRIEPDGYLAAMNFPKREYSASRGDDLYRRALVYRMAANVPAPELLTFDAPTREECTVNRVNSNTPLQALGCC